MILPKDTFKALCDFDCQKLASWNQSQNNSQTKYHEYYMNAINLDTAHMEEQLRLEILPLARNERFGPEWQHIRCILFIRKNPLKFDVSDESNRQGAYHLLETKSEDEVISWLREQIRGYRGYCHT